VFKISFRVDDVFPRMDWEKFYDLKKLFDRYGIKPLIGIIPDNQNQNLNRDLCRGDFWQEMRSLGENGWSIAQHGFTHELFNLDSGILGLNSRSEFSGDSFEVQKDKIKKGIDILSKNGIKTNIWMAPAHNYDENTLKALKDLGFKYITDGYSAVCYKKNGLLFIPAQTSKAIKLPFGVVTVVLHPATMSENEMQDLDVFIRKNRRSVVYYSEMLGQPANNFLAAISENFLLKLGQLKNLTKANISQPFMDLSLPFFIGKNVLDVGTLGHSLEQIGQARKVWHHGYIKRVAKNIAGVDLESQEILDEANNKFGVNIIYGNAESIKLNRKFDTIFAGDVIEHVSNQGLFFENLGGHLKDDGQLVITTPNSFDIARTLSFFVKGLCNDPVCHDQHTLWHSPRTLISIAGRHGFEVNNIFYYSHRLLLDKIFHFFRVERLLPHMMFALRKK